VVIKNKFIALIVGGVAVAAAVAIVLVTTLSGPSKPSGYGDPALAALVAAPEQLYSPSSPLETSAEAAKRIEPLITKELFQAMSVPPERQSNYKMGLVNDQHGTVKARAYIDDHGVRNGDDTKTSVSRTVIIIQQITFPDGRKIEDKFGLLVDAVLVDGKWKAKAFAPEPTLDALNKEAPPPPPPSGEPPTGEPPTGEPPTGGPPTGSPPTGGPSTGPSTSENGSPPPSPPPSTPPSAAPSTPTVTITNTSTIPSTVTKTIPSPISTQIVPTTITPPPVTQTNIKTVPGPATHIPSQAPTAP
jgi:hypothetical protein